MSPRAAPCFLFAQVGSVAVASEYHIACVEGEYCFFLACCVVQKLLHLVHRFLCRVCLFGGDRAKGDGHGVVDGLGVVEEGAEDLLDV